MNIVVMLTFIAGVATIVATFSRDSTFPSDDIATVQRQHESSIMNVPGVVGVGIGECEGEPCIRVLVEDRTPELESRIPKELEGFKVDIEATGPIQAQPETPPT